MTNARETRGVCGSLTFSVRIAAPTPTPPPPPLMCGFAYCAYQLPMVTNHSLKILSAKFQKEKHS